MLLRFRCRYGDRGAARTRQPRQYRVGTTGMLALRDSAGEWKAKTSSKLIAKVMILDGSTGRVFYVTNNEKNELHERSEISLGFRCRLASLISFLSSMKAYLFSSKSLFSLFSFVMLISRFLALPLWSISRPNPRHFRPAPASIHGREKGAAVKASEAARRVALTAEPLPAQHRREGRKAGRNYCIFERYGNILKGIEGKFASS